MKLGIISYDKNSPIAKVMEIIAKTKAGLEVEQFEEDTFEPAYVQQQSIDVLFFVGLNESDAGLALAIKKHITQPLMYLSVDNVVETYTKNLTANEIEVYHVLETSERKGAESLLARLNELGKKNDR